jgi:hypothetical protein
MKYIPISEHFHTHTHTLKGYLSRALFTTLLSALLELGKRRHREGADFENSAQKME